MGNDADVVDIGMLNGMENDSVDADVLVPKQD